MSNGIIVPRRDGLAGEWLLNGNALDTAGTNNGTATNVTYTNTDRGYQKQCGVFGATSTVTSSATFTNIQTLYFRIYPTSNTKTLATLVTGTSIISINASSQITTTGLANVSVYVNNTATTQLTLNVWNDVVITCDAKTFSNLNIGSSSYTGNIGRVAFFNRAISATEIQNCYLEGLRKLGGGSMSGLFDGMVGHMNSLDGTEFSDIFRGITATRTAGTATTDNLGFTRAITNPNYSYTSITYTNVYSFENSGSGWGIVSNPSGVSATACNRTTVLRELFFYNRALSTAEQTAISDLCKLNYVNWFDGPNRISIPENLKASCKLFLEGTVSGTTAYDSSGNGNNGTLVNSPTTQRSQGYKGFVFNGTNQSITFPGNTDTKPTGPFSVGFFIKTSTTSINYIGLMQSYSQVSTVAGWEVMQNVSQAGTSPNCIRFVVGNNTGFTIGTQYVEAFGPSVVTDGKYHYIECVYTGTQIIVYQDGVPGTPVNWSNGLAYTVTSYQRIGCSNNSGTNIQFFGGIIGNPSINNVALGRTEVYQLAYSFFIP